VIDLASLQRDAEATGRRCTAGAVIFDAAARVFVMRRSDEVPLPGLWDIVGGHVEPGETIEDALRREVAEETGWSVVGEPTPAFVCEWELPHDPARPRREFDFIVAVDGDFDRPRLASREHVEHRWLARDELAVLDENRGADDGLIRRIVSAAFAQRRDGDRTAGFTSPHATVFVDPIASDIEARRRRWDPVMAAQIAAHVTVAYPREVADLDDMTERVRAAASSATPFELELGAVVDTGDPDYGVFVEVRDVDGGWARLRDAIAGTERDDRRTPHVTLVHPRTSGLGRIAWGELERLDLRRRVVVRTVAVTGFDGHRWVTTSAHPLA